MRRREVEGEGGKEKEGGRGGETVTVFHVRVK